MDIKELVTRADELVKGGGENNRSPVDAMAISTDSHYTFLTSLDSRDASGEEDEMSCGSPTHDCEKCSSSSESSCSHDLTITSSSASNLDNVKAAGRDDIMSRSMHEHLNPSVFGGGGGGSTASGGKRRKVRRRTLGKKPQQQPSSSSSSSSVLSPLSQSTPVKNNVVVVTQQGPGLKKSSAAAETDEDQEELLEEEEEEEEEIHHRSRDLLLQDDHEVLETSSLHQQRRKQLSDEISEAELSEYWDQVCNFTVRYNSGVLTRGEHILSLET